MDLQINKASAIKLEIRQQFVCLQSISMKVWLGMNPSDTNPLGCIKVKIGGKVFSIHIGFIAFCLICSVAQKLSKLLYVSCFVGLMQTFGKEYLIGLSLIFFNVWSALSDIIGTKIRYQFMNYIAKMNVTIAMSKILATCFFFLSYPPPLVSTKTTTCTEDREEFVRKFASLKP